LLIIKLLRCNRCERRTILLFRVWELGVSFLGRESQRHVSGCETLRG
jgi:hypothetical protein